MLTWVKRLWSGRGVVVAFALVVAVSALFTAATSRTRAGPKVAIVQGPRGETTSTTVVFRLRTGGRRASCRLDRNRFRRCRRSMTYRHLRLGRHTFTLRVRGPERTVYRRRHWVVIPPGRKRPVFSDEFDGRTFDRRGWSLYDSPGNSGHGLRRPSAFGVDGKGHLVVTATMVNGRVVSGGMASRRAFTYGRFEFRVRTEPDPIGTMSGVVLTWPQSGDWPVDGETDIYETGAVPNRRAPFYSYVHYGSTNEQYYFRHDADGAEWHTMVMDWDPSAIKVYRDGLLVWTLEDRAAIPDVAHHLCVQLDATASRTLIQPVRMYVDYVRVYQ